MANSYPNFQVPGNSNTPAEYRNTTAAASKLRDSCHACALSKVKCHKEKPTCSRCAKRNITCDYFITKRPGRKRTNTQQNNDETNDTTNDMTSASSTGSGAWIGTANSNLYALLGQTNDHLTPLNLTSTSPRSVPVSGADVPGTDCSSSLAVSNVFYHLPMSTDSSLSSTITGLNNDFDYFLTSPSEFPELEELDMFNLTQERTDIAKLLLPGDNIFNPSSKTSSVNRSNIAKTLSSSNAQGLSTGNTNMRDAPESMCSCLVEALDIMKKLSSTNSSIYGPRKNLDKNLDPTSNSVVRTVVMENKKVIEAVSTMLRCLCRDGYLLILLSMVIFKILDRYAEAVRKRREEANKDAETPNRGADFENTGRVSAQLILGELHLVQQLVNQLSPKLKASGVETSSETGGIIELESYRRDAKTSNFSVGRMVTTFFSARILDQIEVDLRKALSASSLEIIKILRQM